jgi:hypothetical protein
MYARTLTLCSLLTLVTLAGCAQEDGTIKAADAELSHDGSGSGSHEETAGCDSDGVIKGNGNISDGQVTITVTDAEGKVMFDRTYDGNIDVDQQVSGAEGTWKIHGERSANDLVGDSFNGKYSFTLTC